MKHLWILPAIIIALMHTLACAEETGPKSTGGHPLISNVFVDTDLRQVLQDISMQAAFPVIPDQSISGFVTCDLQDVPLNEALEIVLAGTGYQVHKTPNYYLVYAPDPKNPALSELSETRIIQLNYISPSSAANLLPERLKEFVNTDKSTDSISITSPPQLMEKIVNNLKLMDRPPRQVILDARVVIIESVRLQSMGVKWNWPDVRAGTYSDSSLHSGSGNAWPWAVAIGYNSGKEFTNSLLLTLDLLSQNDEASVIANPQVMAQHGKPAELKVNTEEYFQILQEGYYARSDIEKIQTGTTLKLTPQINDNDDITLAMSTEVSDVVARGEHNLPVVTRRTAESTVRIKNGGTAVVAGLMNTRSQSSKSAVPVLSELPLIGALFRSSTSQYDSRQVAIFVTAQIVPEDGPVEEPKLARPAYEPVGEEFKLELKKAVARLIAKEE